MMIYEYCLVSMPGRAINQEYYTNLHNVYPNLSFVEKKCQTGRNDMLNIEHSAYHLVSNSRSLLTSPVQPEV